MTNLLHRLRDVPDPDEPDPYWEYDEHDCANCAGEGFVSGCSWDWQCDTYDEGEGTCLCSRPCDWCSPRKPTPHPNNGEDGS